jgi:hypothetical protein
MAAAKRTSNRKPKRKASSKARHRSRARSARISRGKMAAAAKRRNKV